MHVEYDGAITAENCHMHTHCDSGVLQMQLSNIYMCIKEKIAWVCVLHVEKSCLYWLNYAKKNLVYIK